MNHLWLPSMKSKIKTSFLAEVTGDFYEMIEDYARPIAIYGGIVIAVAVLLSLLGHHVFFADFLSVVTGLSIPFVIYVFAVIVALDEQVDVDAEFDGFDHYHGKKIIPNRAYKRTKIRFFCMVLLGALAIYGTNVYRNRYAFECQKVMADTSQHIYHIVDDCPEMKNNAEDGEDAEHNLFERYGHELDDSYTLCPICKEWTEEAEADARTDSWNP